MSLIGPRPLLVKYLPYPTLICIFAVGDKILYCERNNEIVAYVIYTRCRRHVFNSGNKNDYYVIFYYT